MFLKTLLNQAALEFRFQIYKNGAQMEVHYQEGSICVVPVKYYHELERSVKMIGVSTTFRPWRQTL